MNDINISNVMRILERLHIQALSTFKLEIDFNWMNIFKRGYFLNEKY